jgi:hypothetical protein
LKTICIEAKRFDGKYNEYHKGYNYLRMDNLMTYSKEKKKFQNGSNLNGSIDAEEFCFKLSYVIGNVENNFSKKINDPIHYGKRFLVGENQYILVLSPNLICCSDEKAFNWVFAANYKKKNKKIKLIETRRYQKDYLLGLEKERKACQPISENGMKEIRKKIFNIFVGEFAKERLKYNVKTKKWRTNLIYKKWENFKDFFTLMRRNDVKKLEEVNESDSWDDFAEKFSKWEKEMGEIETILWKRCFDVYEDCSHLKKVLEADKSGKYSNILKELQSLIDDFPKIKPDDIEKEFENWKNGNQKEFEILKTYKSNGL